MKEFVRTSALFMKNMIFNNLRDFNCPNKKIANLMNNLLRQLSKFCLLSKTAQVMSVPNDVPHLNDPEKDGRGY